MLAAPLSPAATIQQQHLGIIRCCDELLALLRGTAPLVEVSPVRTRLAGLLHANLMLEEQHIAQPIRRLDVADRPRRFAELGDEATELRASYSQHVGRWTVSAIEADRTGYTRAAADLVQQTKAHLARKQAVMPDWLRAAEKQSPVAPIPPAPTPPAASA